MQSFACSSGDGHELQAGSITRQSAANSINGMAKSNFFIGNLLRLAANPCLATVYGDLRIP